MVERMNFLDAVLKAKEMTEYTYESLPKVNLRSFCINALNDKTATEREIDGKKVYACNLRTYRDEQLPGDLITEITEIDDGERSIVVVQDAMLVTSPEMNDGYLPKIKTIIFEAVQGGVYDPELDAVCWTSKKTPDMKLCIDIHGRVMFIDKGDFTLPEDMMSMHDFDTVVHELGIEDAKTFYDIVKKDKDYVKSQMGFKAVAGAYLMATGEAVAPGTRIKKYSEKPWEEIKIRKLGPRSEVPFIIQIEKFKEKKGE